MLGSWRGNSGPGGKSQHSTAGFMASVTCGLTAEDWDMLWNPTLVSNMGLYLPLDRALWLQFGLVLVLKY